MLLTRWGRTTDALCHSCGVEHGHALDCAAWWNDYRRTRFDNERVSRYRRITWVAVTGMAGAWLLDVQVAATALLAVSIVLFAVLVFESRKPIA
jgi:hypothetical protein